MKRCILSISLLTALTANLLVPRQIVRYRACCYDADGNLLTKTAPKPNQTGTATVATAYNYDSLNRLVKKSYNDGSTATVQYGYDAVALTGCTTAPSALTDSFPIGRRTAMCDGSGATSWKHDQMGRALRALGRDTEAEGCFEKAIQLDPSFSSAYYQLAMLMRDRRDQGRFTDLIARFRASVEKGKKPATP